MVKVEKDYILEKFKIRMFWYLEDLENADSFDSKLELRREFYAEIRGLFAFGFIDMNLMDNLYRKVKAIEFI